MTPQEKEKLVEAIAYAIEAAQLADIAETHMRRVVRDIENGAEIADELFAQLRSRHADFRKQLEEYINV